MKNTPFSFELKLVLIGLSFLCFGYPILATNQLSFSIIEEKKQASFLENFYFIDNQVNFPSLIEEALHQQADTAVFYLFSHGQPGALLIEGEWQDARGLIEWLLLGNKLVNKKQLNIYGCEFAKGSRGLAAVKLIETTLGLSVAASNDLTGIDGDWELEMGQQDISFKIENYSTNLQPWTMGVGDAANGSTITTCGGSFYDSGGSGGNYNENINNETVTFTATSGQMQAVFNSFDLEDSWDFLKIYDGPNNSGTPMVYSSTSPGTVTSTSGSLTFEFFSDGINTELGWDVTLSSTDAGCSGGGGGGGGGTPCSTESENTTPLDFAGFDCFTNGTKTSTITITEDMTITDVNIGLNVTLDYRHHLYATLTSPQGTTVLLTSNSTYPGTKTSEIDNWDLLFDSASGNSMNDNDSDNVAAPYYDRTAAPANSLNAFNGQNAMGNWILTICDDVGSTGSDGNVHRWKLFIEGTCASTSGTTFPNANYTIDTGGTENTCSGTFADTGDSNEAYGDNETYTMTFCSDQSNHISFTFEHFNTEATNDVLSIYDGNSTSATKIGDYSGTGPTNSPGVVTSTDTCLTFEFTTNGSNTSPGWIASISCTGLPLVNAMPPFWTGYPTNSACGSTSQIGGIVYEDIDNDGVQDTKEPGIYGVSVTLYDTLGQVGSPTTTDADGAYTFSSLSAATVYRVEFTIPDNFKEGPFGNESGTAVQFIESGRCDASLGIIDVAHYCDVADPLFVIPCFVNGDPNHGSNTGETGIARFRYSDMGDSPSSTYTNYVTIDAIGTVWGTTYNGLNNKLYMSTVLKRHSGLGPNGIGAIYQHNDGDANTVASVFYDFGDAAGMVDTNTIRFPGGGNAFGEEGACGTCDNVDPTTFDQVGKVGFGDIDINLENNKLYATNLYDRKIYTIDLDNPIAGSATPLPGIPWLDNAVCSNGIARPWGLEFRRGKLYVGVICDASLSACTPGEACSDLTAEIYSFDGTVWSNELSFALDYYRDAYSKGADYFVKWIDDWNEMKPYVENVTDANFAQPIIMDLEFDDDNSLIIGIGDRTGFQLGYLAPNPTASSGNTSERSMAFGDILRVAYDPTTENFTLESDGLVGGLTSTNSTSNSGPNGKSFYWGDYWTGIGENKYQGSLGGLMLRPNSGEVATSMADAISYYSNGISWMNNTNGADVKRLEVYQGSPDGDSPLFAKGSGVGDMSLMCEAPSLEIGNIVWWDEDLDGLQDPNEPGIAGVTIELWVDPNGNTQGNNPLDGDEVKVASTSTDSYGRYIFSYNGNTNGLSAENWSFTTADSIRPNTHYSIRIPNWETDAGVVAYRNSLGYSGHIISPTQNQSGIDGAGGLERDNNSYDNPGTAAIAVLTGNYGDNNHNFDFAFGGVGGCDAPEVIPTANTPCHGETLNLMTTVSGGSAPYIYNWSGPNSFTSTAQNPSIIGIDSFLHAGTYYLTVTDDLGCEDTTHINVHINKLTINTNSSDATCGVSDGVIDLTVDVGVAPFSYNWSNSETTEDISGLVANNYTVTVTDADGCTAITSTGIGSSGSVTLSASHVEETCSSSNGSIDLTITGTHTTIDWDNDGTGDNDDLADLTNLSAGTYNVTVNNAGNCPAILSVTLINTAGPSISTTQINTTCGNSTGSIDLTVNGGVAPYTYQWDNDGTGDNDDTQDVAGLAADSYNVTVTDANGCIAMTSVTITDTPRPSLNPSSTNETCGNANGSINLTVAGNGPFTYIWNNGLTTQNITGLGAGIFSVTVTDANGCTATTSTSITNTAGPTLSIASTNATDCNASDGSIDLTVTGGTASFTYDWDNDGYENPDNDGQDLAGLIAGNYTVIVTDANGCTANIGTTVLNNTDPTLNSIITDPTTCSETGSVDLTVTDAVLPVIYDWSNDGLGDNDDVEDISGLSAGNYTVIVTGADGCSAQTNASIRTIRSPILNDSIILPTCGNTDGEIHLTIEDQDGSSPYTIDWDNDGTGDNDDTQNQIGIGTGNYNVTITNGINCSVTGTYSLAPEVSAPILTLSQTNPNCENNDGSINLTISGGTTPYQIDWDNDGTGDNDGLANLSGLSAGTFNVTVTDNGGCQAVETTELISSEPPVLNATISLDSCNISNGSIDLSIIGVSPFTIDWDNDGTGDNDDLADINGLSAGTYNVTVIDGNGCNASASINLGSYCNVCYSIDSLITLRTICNGTSIDTLAVTTDLVFPDSIAFVYFTAPQTDSSRIYTMGMGIDTVQITNGNDTARIFNISGFTNNDLIPDTLYVYAIAYPTPISSICRPYEEILVIVNACDWGDLPDTSSVTNASDYQTTSANNGPVHVITSELTLGTTVDAEIDGQPSSDALGDNSDEDGLNIMPSMNIGRGGAIKLPLSYVNATGRDAHIEAWLDWNNNGAFEEGEMIYDAINPSTPFIQITVPNDAVTGEYLGLRIRISNQDNMTPYNLISSGEVEDYLIGIDCPTQICVPISTTVQRR